ncbi:unnamed protein product, partial [Mesorhabditis spiculigera]
MYGLSTSRFAEHHQSTKASLRGAILIALPNYLIPSLAWIIGAALLRMDEVAESSEMEMQIRTKPQLAFMRALPGCYIMNAPPIFPPYIMFSGLTPVICGVITAMCAWIPMFPLLAWHSFYILSDQHTLMSAKTRAMHRKSLQVLIIGVAIPLLSVVGPYLAVVVIVLGDFTVSQINAKCLRPGINP